MSYLPKTALVALLLSPAISFATIFTFDLEGKAGAGLLSGNENGTINGVAGSGGEFGDGIYFDDVAKTLTINIAWGSGNGFSDLTSAVTAAHVHGITASAGTDSYLENAGVVFGIMAAPFTLNSSASSGFVTGTSAALNPTNEAALFAGQLYINVHTSTNTGGEIRANLVNPTAIPEPSALAALAGATVLGLTASRRRRRVGA